ncbi:membrane protein DedA with SNARE-associated domain [Thermocatellispora tengchongensis]|uniref:Membrane protein DedA with SNARE-associated domain n=1 Tax=Thermocatellispora tengchongensis TaxID=1073253 RepID=A0A840PGP3_9ACTN|nr:DedA family protein [Thermocatellispora tengchongensis]MBB5138312.1 membrane protein DedA with SNARE-associated domain [Thermocatellispora tengchongensis]
MTDVILDLLHQVMTSPWVYLALFAVSLIDGFFPAVPSETSVITAGVFAAAGDPNLFGVVAAAALGAFAGDHVSYAIGRLGGSRLRARLRPGTRRHKAFAWAERALAERGGLVLVVARYIPGGRTATTMTMGAVGYPARSFAFFDTLAAGSWAVYSAMVGYLGGLAFENDPIKGLLLGLGIALTVTTVVEIIRYVRKRRAARSPRTGDGDELPALATSDP